MRQKTYREFEALNADHRDAYHLSNLYEAALYSMVEAAGSVSVGLLLWYGGGEVLHGIIGIGTLVAFKEYIHRFFVPLRDFSQKYAVMQSAMASAERIFQLLDTPVDIANPRIAASTETIPWRSGLRSGLVSLQARRVDIEEMSRSVSSPERKSPSWAPPARAKRQRSNCSIAFTIFRRVRSKSAVSMCRDWDLRALRRHIGVVLQDVFLFSGDVRTNLALGNPSIPLERIREAAEIANADRFIRRLPDGYAAQVRERGSNFSGGQRQLLSLARVLVYQPEILVMDEATSSIDTETEALIQDALEKVMRDRTCLLIAHRLSTIRNADRIIVLHHGEVREVGSHAELMDQQGIYYRLYQLQYEREELKLAAHDLPAKLLA